MFREKHVHARSVIFDWYFYVTDDMYCTWDQQSRGESAAGTWPLVSGLPWHLTRIAAVQPFITPLHFPLKKKQQHVTALQEAELSVSSLPSSFPVRGALSCLLLCFSAARRVELQPRQKLSTDSDAGGHSLLCAVTDTSSLTLRHFLESQPAHSSPSHPPPSRSLHHTSKCARLLGRLSALYVLQHYRSSWAQWLRRAQPWERKSAPGDPSHG